MGADRRDIPGHEPALIVRRTLPEQVAGHLRRRIEAGAYPVGRKIPSATTLGEEFGVSHVTVLKALRRLSREGYVASRAGRCGTVVLSRAPQRPERVRRVAAFHFEVRSRNRFDNFSLDVVGAMQEELGRRHIFIANCNPDEPEGRRVARGQAQGAAFDAFIIDRLKFDAAWPLVRSVPKPVITVNCAGSGPGRYAVLPDYERIGRETAERFVARGCEKFLFYKAPPGGLDDPAWGRNTTEYLIHRSVFEAFSRRVRELTGRRVDILAEPSREEVEEIVSGFLRCPRAALLSVSDSFLDRVRRCLAEKGLRPGRDPLPAITGVIDLETYRDRQPGFSTWRVDPERLGRLAAETADRVMSGEDVPSVVLMPVEWIGRGTV